MAKKVLDQMQREVIIPSSPKRIVSLVPSQTELLFYLGLDEEVVGITKFCVHPRVQFKSKTRVGGTKKYNFEKIKSLNPDLIIGNKEENDQSQIEELAKSYPVWMSDILTLSDALQMIESLGTIVGKESRAKMLKENIIVDFNRLEKNISSQSQSPSAAYLIWKNPMMVAASQTFIHEMLNLAGFKNTFEDLDRYPEITNEKLADAKPDVIFLSSEPFPFKEKHIQEIQTVCPNSIVKLVDGELFSWYGNRLILAVPYFEKLYLEITKQAPNH